MRTSSSRLLSSDAVSARAGRSAAAPLAVAALLLTSLLLTCAPSFAQATASSALEGTVTDIKQAVVQGATATVTKSGGAR